MYKGKLLILLLITFGCFNNSSAQDLKSILSDVAKTVVGDKATTAQSIIGTWKYVAPDCKFESESLLAKAGGEVAASKVELKMAGIYQKFGFTGCTFTFNADKTYSIIFKGKVSKGTYVFDADKKTIVLTTRAGMPLKEAHVIVNVSSMSLLFNANKIMSALKTLTSMASTVNSTASTVNALASNYDGMMIGFELKK